MNWCRITLAAIAIASMVAVGVGSVCGQDDEFTGAKVIACSSTIAACGCTINKRGLYTLSADLSITQGQTSDGDCLDVTAAHVILFLNGFGIDGVGTANGLHLSPPLDSQMVLTQAVIPEYILRNVSLGDAGCRCIRVPDYAGRQGAHFNPNLVPHKGELGACTMVAQL
jgi:hypothetical protein